MSQGAHLLIIVNFIPPYDTEVATILAAPEGGRVRFRYQAKYAPTITNPASLSGQRGSVVLRDRGSGWFMPLRSFEVVDARSVGDVIYLTVDLSHTAAISSADTTRDSQLQQFNGLMKDAIGGFSNCGDADLLNLILHESGDIYRLLAAWTSSSSADETSNWGNCVKLIAEKLPASDLDFFKLVAISGNDGAISSDRTESGASYRVSAGHDYKIEILQRTYTGKKGDSSVTSSRTLEIGLPALGVSARHSSLPILGKYDLLSFDLHVEDGAETGPQLCSLSVSRGGASRYGVEIVLDVERSGRAQVARRVSFALFLVAVFAYLSPGAFGSLLELVPGVDVVKDDAIEKAAVLGMLAFSTSSGLGLWLSEKIELN